MNTDKKITLAERVKSPTPKFFRKVRTIGLMIGAIGGALLAAPVALPAVVGTIAGYLATIGVVASAVSQTAVRD
ncbi:hypothetical protein C3K47_07835 [Solitalea longa]|uniref:Uncharacterized protein n=1 Tax=Solitalea longa TaxID=2079460 RepID=A0A2S5A373_9SPHI|nr:hypothetical protein [Solitalea longa]POY36964.1 hypothetical protein C3K47_07835 [Solitalea longa]